MTTPAARDELTSYRLDRVEVAIIKLTETTAQLVRLEEQHIETRNALNRAFEAIRAVEQRTSAIESQMPRVTLATGWVFAAVVAMVGLSGAMVWRVSSALHAIPTPAIVAPAAQRP